MVVIVRPSELSLGPVSKALIRPKPVTINSQLGFGGVVLVFLPYGGDSKACWVIALICDLSFQESCSPKEIN